MPLNPLLESHKLPSPLSQGLYLACTCLHRHRRYIWRLDYAGITTLIVTSFFPMLFYGFHCQPMWRFMYLSSTCAMGASQAMPCALLCCHASLAHANMLCKRLPLPAHGVFYVCCGYQPVYYVPSSVSPQNTTFLSAEETFFVCLVSKSWLRFE